MCLLLLLASKVLFMPNCHALQLQLLSVCFLFMYISVTFLKEKRTLSSLIEDKMPHMLMKV